MKFKEGHIINHENLGVSIIEKIENDLFHLLVNFSKRHQEKNVNKIKPIPMLDVIDRLGFKIYPIQGGYGRDTSGEFIEYFNIINNEEVFITKYFKTNTCSVSVSGEIKENGKSYKCNRNIHGKYLHEIQDSFLELTGKEFNMISINSILRNNYIYETSILNQPEKTNKTEKI